MLLQHGRSSCSTACAPCSTAGAPATRHVLLAAQQVLLQHGRCSCSMAGAPAARQVLLQHDMRACSMSGAPGTTCAYAAWQAHLQHGRCSWQAHLRRYTSLSEGAPACRKLKKLVCILECAIGAGHVSCSCAVPGLASGKSSRT